MFSPQSFRALVLNFMLNAIEAETALWTKELRCIPGRLLLYLYTCILPSDIGIGLYTHDRILQSVFHCSQIRTKNGQLKFFYYY
jgi:hypothetical protein